MIHIIWPYSIDGRTLLFHRRNLQEWSWSEKKFIDAQVHVSLIKGSLDDWRFNRDMVEIQFNKTELQSYQSQHCKIWYGFRTELAKWDWNWNIYAKQDCFSIIEP